MATPLTKYTDSEATEPGYAKVAVIPGDRRESHRAMTVMRVAKLANEALEIEGLGVVRNVSEGGMMIEAHIAVEVGQVIAVSLLEGRKVLGEVLWKEGNSIGLRFDAPVRIADVLARPDMLANGQRARLPRLLVNKIGEVATATNKLPVTICDISQRGVKVECEKPIATGQQLLVTLDGQKVRGTVKWNKDGFTGIEFHRLLPVDELLRWLPHDE